MMSISSSPRHPSSSTSTPQKVITIDIDIIIINTTPRQISHFDNG